MGAKTAEEELSRDTAKLASSLVYGIKHDFPTDLRLSKLMNRMMILRVLGDSQVDYWLTGDEKDTLEGRMILFE